MDVQGTMNKVKELVKKGNVSRIVVKRKGDTVLNLPVSAGVVGAVVGLAYAKWALLAAALATVGFGCTVEVIKDDGAVVNVVDEESGKKVREFATDTVEKVKENIPISFNLDIKKEDDTVDGEVVDFTESVDFTEESSEEPKE